MLGLEEDMRGCGEGHTRLGKKPNVTPSCPSVICFIVHRALPLYPLIAKATLLRVQGMHPWPHFTNENMTQHKN